jgi:hypothetical protein
MTKQGKAKTLRMPNRSEEEMGRWGAGALVRREMG